jgi:hypothetical protein
MSTVHKYELEIRETFDIYPRAGFKPIHVGLDPQGQPCMWAEVDIRKPSVCTRLCIIGTGIEKPEHAREHIGSFVKGSYVGHLYQTS